MRTPTSLEARLSVTREILTSQVPRAPRVESASSGLVASADALGPSVVARQGALAPDAGAVGFQAFHRAASGRMWIGVAAVAAADESSRVSLARTLGVARGLADSHPSPAALLAAVREELARDGETDCEVALFVAALTVATGELVCASAAYRAPWLVRRAGDPLSLGVPIGPPLGDATDDYHDHAVVLAAGDAVVVFGAAEDASGEADAVRAARGLDAASATRDEPAWPTVLVLRHDASVDARVAHTLELRIVSELDAIERVTTRFDAFAAAHHVPDAVRRTFDIAFDDLVNNVISYAYAGEPDHLIDIRVVLDATGVEASIADDGPAFDPFAMEEPDTELDLDDRDIGGLGVHLVRSMMDEARYERQGDRNVVIIRKHLPVISPNKPL